MTTRVQLAQAISEAIQKQWPGAGVAPGRSDEGIQVLMVELPDGGRHHVRIIDVQGREHAYLDEVMGKPDASAPAFCRAPTRCTRPSCRCGDTPSFRADA